jgi:hypothetical protein
MVFGDAPVSEIEPEQIGVTGRELAESMRDVTTTPASS